MTFYELYTSLGSKFPKELSCEWDNDGIMCADDLNAQVKKVLITLDITDEAVSYAIENGYDTIISHHPLVFKAQKAICPCNFTQKKLISLIKNGIRAISFHTRLDACDGGVNDTLASLIGFEKIEKDLSDPIGRVCTLNESVNIDIFAKKVKKLLSAPYVSYIGAREVQRVYVVGGDGKDSISNAISCGADTLLTGNTSYNSSMDAEEMGLNVIEAGHFYTENPVCAFIQGVISSIDSDIKTELFYSNKVKIV